jgi:hypothetical protein
VQQLESFAQQRSDLLFIYVDSDRCENFTKKMGIKEVCVTLMLHNAKIVRKVDGDLDKIVSTVSEVLEELK